LQECRELHKQFLSIILLAQDSYSANLRLDIRKVNSQMRWSDERRIPEELVSLLQEPNLPKELRTSILQAINEVEQNGAVTYTTKARVEYYLHQFRREQEEQELKQLDDMWNREVQ